MINLRNCTTFIQSHIKKISNKYIPKKMKRTKYRKYQAPQLKEASLETEGVFCQSLRTNAQLDEIYVVDIDGEDAEPSDFEF